MNEEEYGIIFVQDEGRAVLNKKTRKVYHSEFQIIEEKNDEIKDLQTRWDSLREWLEKTDRTIDFNYVVVRAKDILDKMNELEGVDNENN